MALDQPPHHVGLTRRAKRGAGLGGFFRRDQRVDDVAALHQEAMHAFIDAVDLAAQVGKRGRGLGSVSHDGLVLCGPSGEIKENVGATAGARPDLTGRLQCHYLWVIVVVI